MDPDGDLLNTPFGGRYCDQTIPHDRVSLYQTLVISFYTDLNTTHGPDIFQGLYSFINASTGASNGSLFSQGTNLIYSIYLHSTVHCGHTHAQSNLQLRHLQWPATRRTVHESHLPGCVSQRSQLFLSIQWAQRSTSEAGIHGLWPLLWRATVSYEQIKWDFYLRNPLSCPFDFVKIFDGDSDQAPLINVYCGQQRQLFVFSSGTTLFVQFTTLRRISDSQNRGFSGYFEFSEKFVNLGMFAMFADKKI